MLQLLQYISQKLQGTVLLEVLPRILQQAGTHQDATFVAAKLLLVLAAVLHPAVTTSAHTTLRGAILGHCAKLTDQHSPERRVWDLVDSPSIQLVCLVLAGLKAYGGLIAAEVHCSACGCGELFAPTGSGSIAID